MSSKFNSRKKRFLSSLPKNLIFNCLPNFKNKINFNFSFFDGSQGQDFNKWSQKQLAELLDKLKCYSKEDMEYWKKMRIGTKNSKVLVVYGAFPISSDFKHPQHIPLDVEWARFRLEGDSRLIGFIINKNDCLCNEICPDTFYVVFLDQNHKFFKPS
ncbi:MAG TPA: hypothetical protein PLD55_00600 [bacterium]|jgi:hypothetical protein|nr:hypothetical protein [bacterium]HQB08989.1 hypothetical protein [bacterium]HQM83158.1 hypothetical protein [bacterium]